MCIRDSPEPVPVYELMPGFQIGVYGSFFLFIFLVIAGPVSYTHLVKHVRLREPVFLFLACLTVPWPYPQGLAKEKDVYKGQGWHRGKMPYIGYGHRLLPHEKLTENLSEAQADSLLRCDLEPVSYTHLDVYKRQKHSSN